MLRNIIYKLINITVKILRSTIYYQVNICNRSAMFQSKNKCIPEGLYPNFPAQLGVRFQCQRKDGEIIHYVIYVVQRTIPCSEIAHIRVPYLIRHVCPNTYPIFLNRDWLSATFFE